MLLRISPPLFAIAMWVCPEAVLISLKAVINNRILVDGSPYAADWTGHQLREKISSWCIQEFFRQKTA